VDDSGQTYYPNCIDGGVFINNPAIAAAVEIIRHNQDPLYNKFTDLSDVYILSLGTGKTDKSIIDKDSKKWGLYKWGLPIIEVMMQANSQAVHHHMEEIFKSNYLRVDIDIEKKFSEMSDSTEETYKYLVAKANKDIVNDPDWLQDIQDFINRASL
jgi:patatin-like phospholipase/acyl hydrolase